MSILSFLGLKAEKNADSAAATETVRKITRALDQLDPQRARYLATFAYLLGRAARADMSISQEETRIMEQIVMNRGGIPEEQAVIVVQIAKTQNALFGGTENYLVSREFKELAGRDERMALLECLYAVAAADLSVSTIEDNEISQIADELRIEHADLISIRSKYREHLAVLKKQ